MSLSYSFKEVLTEWEHDSFWCAGALSAFRATGVTAYWSPCFLFCSILVNTCVGGGRVRVAAVFGGDNSDVVGDMIRRTNFVVSLLLVNRRSKRGVQRGLCSRCLLNCSGVPIWVPIPGLKAAGGMGERTRARQRAFDKGRAFWRAMETMPDD